MGIFNVCVSPARVQRHMLVTAVSLVESAVQVGVLSVLCVLMCVIRQVCVYSELYAWGVLCVCIFFLNIFAVLGCDLT